MVRAMAVLAAVRHLGAMWKDPQPPQRAHLRLLLRVSRRVSGSRRKGTGPGQGAGQPTRLLVQGRAQLHGTCTGTFNIAGPRFINAPIMPLGGRLCVARVCYCPVPTDIPVDPARGVAPLGPPHGEGHVHPAAHRGGRPPFPQLLNTEPTELTEHRAHHNPRTSSVCHPLPQVRAAMMKSEKLLRNILPPSITARLKKGESPIGDSYFDVTLMFTDMVGFTRCQGRKVGGCGTGLSDK